MPVFTKDAKAFLRQFHGFINLVQEIDQASDLEQAIANIHKEHDALKSAYENEKSALADTRKKVTKANAKIKELAKEIELLETKGSAIAQACLDAAKKEAEQIKDKALSDATLEKQKARQEVNSAKATIRELDRVIEDKSKRHDMLTKEIDKLRSKVLG